MTKFEKGCFRERHDGCFGIPSANLPDNLSDHSAGHLEELLKMPKRNSRAIDESHSEEETVGASPYPGIRKKKRMATSFLKGRACSICPTSSPSDETEDDRIFAAKKSKTTSMQDGENFNKGRSSREEKKERTQPRKGISSACKKKFERNQSSEEYECNTTAQGRKQQEQCRPGTSKEYKRNSDLNESSDENELITASHGKKTQKQSRLGTSKELERSSDRNESSDENETETAPQAKKTQGQSRSETPGQNKKNSDRNESTDENEVDAASQGKKKQGHSRPGTSKEYKRNSDGNESSNESETIAASRRKKKQGKSPPRTSEEHKKNSDGNESSDGDETNTGLSSHEGQRNRRLPLHEGGEKRTGRPLKAKDGVWLQFEPAGFERQKCKVCGKIITTVKGTKWNLETHIALHAKMSERSGSETEKAEIVSGLVATLNIPCHAFNNPYMKRLFERANLGAVNDTIARRLTDDAAVKAKSMIAADVKILREQKAVFTLSADEWTWQRRRFLGVTLHCSDTIPCLKQNSIELLSRFRERATAENLEKILADALKEVGLRVSDIRGLTSDAAAVMKKLGKILENSAAPRPFYAQLCLAHGLDLAVRDAFREDSSAAHEEEVDFEANVDSEAESWNIVGILNCDNAERSELDRILQEELAEEEAAVGSPLYPNAVGRIIDKVHAEVTTFITSPALNDEFYAASGDSGPKLVLNVKTRWNSTLRMLQNFLRQEHALRRYYTSRKCAFPLTPSEIEVLKEVANALRLVEKACLRLSSKNATLRRADLALEAMLRALKNESSDFANTLYRCLCIRILQRRGVASRVARFVGRRDDISCLDRWLDEMRAWVHAEGMKKLSRTFLPAGNLSEEVAKHLEKPGRPANADSLEEDENEQEERNTGPDVYDMYGDSDCEEQSLTQHTLSAATLIKYHRKGLSTIPEALVTTMKVVQPTSVPAESAFSTARHFRRYCQEKQKDERYTSYLFLRDFIRKSRPWEAFK